MGMIRGPLVDGRCACSEMARIGIHLAEEGATEVITLMTVP